MNGSDEEIKLVLFEQAFDQLPRRRADPVDFDTDEDMNLRGIGFPQSDSLVIVGVEDVKEASTSIGLFYLQCRISSCANKRWLVPTSSGYRSSSRSRGICSVKAKTCILRAMAVCTTSSSVFVAWPQNWPEWL